MTQALNKSFFAAGKLFVLVLICNLFCGLVIKKQIDFL